MKRFSYLGLLATLLVPGTLAHAQDLGDQVKAANEHLLNQGHVSMASDFFSPEYAGGPDAIREFVTALRDAFPDLHVEIEILMVQGDRVAWLRRHRGTHRGAYMGVPASERVIEWQSMIVSRFQDGKIVQEWGVSDLGERLRAR